MYIVQIIRDESPILYGIKGELLLLFMSRVKLPILEPSPKLDP